MKRKDLDSIDLDVVVENARAAFWGEVSKYFPKDIPGDIAPDIHHEIDVKMKEWIEHWLENLE